MPSRIPTAEIDAALEVVDDWRRKDKVLFASFTFASFREAFDFMTEVADLAEARQHHPDWKNSYNRVAIELTTHDMGGITELDLEMALAISRIAEGRRQPKS